MAARPAPSNLPAMKLSTFTGGMAQTNAYLAETPQGNFLVDAPEGIADWLKGKDVPVSDVLLTHQHYDHVLDAAQLQTGGARLHAFSPYSQELTLEAAARAWGMPISVVPYRIDALLETGRPLRMAGVEMRLAHVPGHAPDSVIFHLPDHQLVFSGDTLFAGGPGATGRSFSDFPTIVASIDRLVAELPSETVVHTGHGGSTTLDAEAPHRQEWLDRGR